MKGLFSLDSPLFRWLSVLTDLFLLNVLWLICCIPIITIGASTCAMYTVTLKMVKDEDCGITKSFFKAFKANWGQATVRHLILLAFAAFLVGDYFIIRETSGNIVLYAILAFGAVIWLFIESYTFPLTSYFDNTNFNTFKNAFLLSIVHFPRSLVIAGLKISPVLFAYFAFEAFYKSSFVWIAFGCALIAYINSYMFRGIFEKLVPKEETDSESSDDIPNE